MTRKNQNDNVHNTVSDRAVNTNDSPKVNSRRFVTGRFEDWWTHYNELCAKHKVDPDRGMLNENIKQSFLNVPIGDYLADGRTTWKEHLREIVREELIPAQHGRVSRYEIAKSRAINTKHLRKE